MRIAIVGLLAPALAAAAEWGVAVNGLRMSLAREGDELVVTFQNVQERREMFLPLGRAVGIGTAEFMGMILLMPDGSKRILQYTGGSGVSPGRLLPYIVPMMPGSVYTVRTPLLRWRIGPALERIEGELKRGARLQADLAAPASLATDYVECYGLQIFWSGHAGSNVLRE